jgi:type IV fimbrial biogenesis protein FimT
VSESRGFTLVELMVTIAVLAIVVGVAAPSLSSFIQSNRTTGNANAMVSALNFARSEAVSRAEEIRFCPVNAAQDACSGSDDWSAGWVAIVQSGPDAGEVLRVWSPLPGSIDLGLETQGNISDGYIDMLPLGNVDVGTGNFLYQWTLRPDGCRSGRPYQRRVDLAPSGRSQVAREEC